MRYSWDILWKKPCHDVFQKNISPLRYHLFRFHTSAVGTSPHFRHAPYFPFSPSLVTSQEHAATSTVLFGGQRSEIELVPLTWSVRRGIWRTLWWLVACFSCGHGASNRCYFGACELGRAISIWGPPMGQRWPKDYHDCHFEGFVSFMIFMFLSFFHFFIPQTVCPHWRVLTVSAKAGAWSGCSLWAAAFFHIFPISI